MKTINIQLYFNSNDKSDLFNIAVMLVLGLKDKICGLGVGLGLVIVWPWPWP